jgi:hypothetical protein
MATDKKLSSLRGLSHRFQGNIILATSFLFCVRFHTLMMEAVRTSEMSVYSNETTWRYIPEGSNIRLLTVYTGRSNDRSKYK